MLDTTKSVPLSSTSDEREAFIRLMVEVKGPHYTIGHLTFFYRYAKFTDIDETVMEKIRQELLEEKFLALVDKKDVDTVMS
jgi:hypothetical protein